MPTILIRPVLLILIFIAAASRSYADTGTTHNLFYLQKLDDTKSVVMRGNFASRKGIDDFFFGFFDAGIRFKLDSSWSLGLSYRQAYLELDSGWRKENRPLVDLIYRGKIGDWGFTNRHRMEFRSFDDASKDRWRYRNESLWTAPFRMTQSQVTPFISEEAFYDVTDHEFNTNWLTIGFSKPFNKNKKWKLGYRLQHQKFGGNWSTRHLFVTGISIFNFGNP